MNEEVIQLRSTSYSEKLGNYIKELEEENKKLKECYCNRTDCGGRIKDSKKYDSLQQRIDKAIKYINKGYYKMNLNPVKFCEELLNILKGDEK